MSLTQNLCSPSHSLLSQIVRHMHHLGRRYSTQISPNVEHGAANVRQHQQQQQSSGAGPRQAELQSDHDINCY